MRAVCPRIILEKMGELREKGGRLVCGVRAATNCSLNELA